MTYISRRSMIRGSAAIGFASGTGLLGAMSATAADTSGYKALVCLFLSGGNDAADTILPTDKASYDALQGLRGDLFESYGVGSGDSSRDRGNLLSINSSRDFGGRTFGLPREWAPIHDLYRDKRLAVIGNVGPLVEPTNRSKLANNSAKLPERLFSHNDQQSTWRTGAVEGRRLGWGGQFADYTAPRNGPGRTFASITASSPSNFLDAVRTLQYPARRQGSITPRSLSQVYDLGRDSDKARELLRNHFASNGVSSDNVFMRDLAKGNNRTITDNKTFDDALGSAGQFTTMFPDTDIGRQLETIATVISIRGTLSAPRQVFYANQGGYDTHENQAPTIAANHRQLAEAMRAFSDAMIELGVDNDVTLFTASEFGRTVQVNGAGTDHGWGGHQFIMGGAVKGGEIYGSLPAYDVGSEFYTPYRARLIPDTSVDQYAAALGKWFGLAGDEIRNALPNLGNFDSVPDLFGLGGTV